jgi:hypothetical protein
MATYWLRYYGNQSVASIATAAKTGQARRAMRVLGGRGPRLALLLASLLAGLVIALLTLHLAGKWEPNFG